MQEARIILCGPFPGSSGIGGYARCNELIATSFLRERFGVVRLPVTRPEQAGRARRLVRDLGAARRCLDANPAPVVHLTAQYQTGTYREAAIYALARSRRRAFLLDIRAGCFVECFERPSAVGQRALWRRVLRGADAIAVEGRRDADWLRRRFGREALWLPNFVASRDADRLPTAPLVPPGPGEPLRLVYTGRLVPDKGLEELVDACALLPARGVDVELSLIGDASGEGSDAGYPARLLARASRGCGERVRFRGSLDHEEVLRQLAAHHVFVFPSRWRGEGHSNAVNEAMQVGLPVVTTDQGFLADVVTPECGVVLERLDAEGLAAAVAGLARDWERLRACGAAARRRVYAEFSDQVVLARLARVYEDLLGSPAPAAEAASAGLGEG